MQPAPHGANKKQALHKLECKIHCT